MNDCFSIKFNGTNLTITVSQLTSGIPQGGLSQYIFTDCLNQLSIDQLHNVMSMLRNSCFSPSFSCHPGVSYSGNSCNMHGFSPLLGLHLKKSRCIEYTFIRLHLSSCSKKTAINADWLTKAGYSK